MKHIFFEINHRIKLKSTAAATMDNTGKIIALPPLIELKDKKIPFHFCLDEDGEHFIRVGHSIHESKATPLETQPMILECKQVHQTVVDDKCIKPVHQTVVEAETSPPVHQTNESKQLSFVDLCLLHV